MKITKGWRLKERKKEREGVHVSDNERNKERATGGGARERESLRARERERERARHTHTERDTETQSQTQRERPDDNPKEEKYIIRNPILQEEEEEKKRNVSFVYNQHHNVRIHELHYVIITLRVIIPPQCCFIPRHKPTYSVTC